MNTSVGNDEPLARALAGAFPTGSEAASDQLRRRVALLARERETKLARRARLKGRLRTGFAVAGVIGIIALSVIAVPRLAAAFVLEKMARAAESARSVHGVTWRIEASGARTRTGETWYAQGKWRLEGPRDVRVFANDTLWRYEPEAHLVTVRRQKEGPATFNPSGFSLGAMARDFARWGWTQKIRVVGATVAAGGRRARQVVIERERDRSRIVLWADTETNLPFRADVQRETGAGWRTELTSEVRYNEPLAPALFAATFPKGARVVDEAQAKVFWERKLSRSIARQTVGERTVVVRDFQVNADGDVFVLFTAGQLAEDDNGSGELYLGDESGTLYLRQNSLQPYVGSRRPMPNYWPGFVFNGEKLEGTWWTPLTPLPKPWTPRRFRLTLKTDAVVRHGRIDWTMRPGEVRRGKPQRYTPDPRTVTFTLPVARPACALLPAYMPYMGMGGLQEYETLANRAQARAEHYHRSAHGDPAQLERALALYHESMRISDEHARASGDVTVHESTWFAVYEVLRDLGRRDEARVALRRAADDDVYHNLDRKVAEARKREGWTD